MGRWLVRYISTSERRSGGSCIIQFVDSPDSGAFVR